VPNLSFEDATKIASEHIASIDPPAPGFVWTLHVDQELSDGWLFAYSFRPLDPSNSEDPLIAGALGFSVSKDSGQIQVLAAGHWFKVKERGQLHA
jgi:hypothetical protein